MSLFMNNLCNTLLANDRLHAIPADIRKTIKPIPVMERVIDDVGPLIIILTTDSNTVSRVLIFFDFF